MSQGVCLDIQKLTCPEGFAASGMTCGVKRSGRPDLALITAPDGATAAGVFTTNIVRAAPVDLSKKHLDISAGSAKAIVISSGVANACTGEQGKTNALKMVCDLSTVLGCDESDVLVNTTGVIGVQLPIEPIVNAYPKLAESVSREGLPDAAKAIMTTDTRPKGAQTVVEFEGRRFTVAGIAKGSGMIHPNMATMIGVLLTDAEVSPQALDSALRYATDRSFHRISVDGDTSTNDSVFALASGKAGDFPSQLVADAMAEVARELALMIVRDGEGARKLLTVRVDGAKTGDEALTVAKTVSASLLVRTAVAGGDPNWGRILAAAGRSGVNFDPDQFRLTASGVPLYENGAPADSPKADQDAAFSGPDVSIEIDLGQGNESEEFFTCDLTEGYVHINADYTT